MINVNNDNLWKYAELFVHQTGEFPIKYQGLMTLPTISNNVGNGLSSGSLMINGCMFFFQCCYFFVIGIIAYVPLRGIELYDAATRESS